MQIIVDTRLLARGTTTGIPGYAQELLNEFIDQDVDTNFTIFYNSFKQKKPLPTQWLSSKNVKIVNTGIPNRLLSLSLKLTEKPTIEKLTGQTNADLLWSPNLDLLTTNSAPRVITVHDISFLHYPKFFSPKYHLWSWLQNQVGQAKTANHILAVSQYTKNDLIEILNVDPSKITVTYPGISAEFTPLPASNEKLNAFKISRYLNHPFFLFLGTLESRKNVICAIRAFNEFKKNGNFEKYELVLAGKPGFGFKEIAKEIEKSPVRDKIRLIHDIKDDERVYLYNSARAFVFPSFFEGFGFPPLEAQACGIPVISSKRTSLGEILRESALELNPWKPETLCNQLLVVESDSSLREGVIKLGLENVKRFNWGKTAEQTLTVFRKISKSK
jgi:glycosyltransferase involved in cell wall biosynthesis